MYVIGINLLLNTTLERNLINMADDVKITTVKTPAAEEVKASESKPAAPAAKKPAAKAAAKKVAKKPAAKKAAKKAAPKKAAAKAAPKAEKAPAAKKAAPKAKKAAAPKAAAKKAAPKAKAAVKKVASKAKAAVKKAVPKKAAAKAAPKAKKAAAVDVSGVVRGALWKAISKSKVKKIDKEIAIQVYAEGIESFFIAVQEGKAKIDPAFYINNNGALNTSADELKKIAAGKYDIIDAVKKGKVNFDGNLSVLLKIMDLF